MKVLNAMSPAGLPALISLWWGVTPELGMMGQLKAGGKTWLFTSLFFCQMFVSTSIMQAWPQCYRTKKFTGKLLSIPCTTPPSSTLGTNREPFIENKRAKQEHTHTH